MIAAHQDHPVIIARSLTKTYLSGAAGVAALRSVSLDIRRGEVTLLRGPSGSGKTTLLSVFGCILSPDGGSLRMVIEAPKEMARMIAPKGSIVVDGISLTVNEVDGARFGVNIIPITQTATNLGQAKEGDRVNLEIDLIARYVARLLTPAE